MTATTTGTAAEKVIEARLRRRARRMGRAVYKLRSAGERPYFVRNVCDNAFESEGLSLAGLDDYLTKFVADNPWFA